jgi:hypothetical protein
MYLLKLELHHQSQACTVIDYIQVQIPASQQAPSWATKYKFVIKPTKGNYETIYSNIAYSESGTNSSYFLLEGENAQKVEAGDRLIVKADSTGAINNCTYATVLEKKTQTAGFIKIYDDAGDELEVFAGTYMKINASNFVINTTDDAIINSQVLPSIARGAQNSYPVVAYPMFTATQASGVVATTLVYDVPVGTRIKMEFDFRRDGVPADKNNACLEKSYTLVKTFTASRDYGNMQEWFEGDNIASTLNEGIETVAEDESIVNTYIPTPNTSQNFPPFPVTGAKSVTQYNAVLTADEIKSATYFGSTATQPNTDFYYRFYVDQVSNNIY